MNVHHRYQLHRWQFATGTAGVVDTSRKLSPVTTIPAANLPWQIAVVSTTSAANLPPVSMTPVANNDNNYQTADNIN